MYRSVRHWGLVGLLMLLILAGLPGTTGAAYSVDLIHSTSAQAHASSLTPVVPLTHDRGGQLTWEVIGLNTAQFHVAVGLRRSYYSPPPNIGQMISYNPLQ